MINIIALVCINIWKQKQGKIPLKNLYIINPLKMYIERFNTLGKQISLEVNLFLNKKSCLESKL